MDVPPGEVINNSMKGRAVDSNVGRPAEGGGEALCGEAMRNPRVLFFHLLINCNVFIRYSGDGAYNFFFPFKRY